MMGRFDDVCRSRMLKVGARESNGLVLETFGHCQCNMNLTGEELEVDNE